MMKIETEIGKYSEYVNPDMLLDLLSRTHANISKRIVVGDHSIIDDRPGRDNSYFAPISLSGILLLLKAAFKLQYSGFFDFAGRTMCNFRVELGTQDIVVHEQVVAPYETASLTVVHVLGHGHKTVIRRFRARRVGSECPAGIPS